MHHVGDEKSMYLYIVLKGFKKLVENYTNSV
jgi:hypothetical protein